QRPDVWRLRDPGDLLRRGTQPARANPEGIRQGGVREGRRADHAHDTHLPADAGRDRHRSRPGRHRAQFHGGIVQYAAVQLPRPARGQRELRLRSEWLSDRIADRGAPVRGRARAEGGRCVSARHRLPHAPAAGAGYDGHRRVHRRMKPKVAFIGTGGTIASLGAGPLDLQNYGATGNVMHADEIIARWPETALVADVLPIRYRNIASTAIDFSDWKALVGLCEQLVA